MKLIDKKLADNIIVSLPRHALPVIKEIWDDKIYNQIYQIKKNDIVFDIGANIGIFSIYAASLGAQVYSFEPNPEIFKILDQNIKKNKLNKKIFIFNYAIGNANEDVYLSIPLSDKIYSEACASITKSFIDNFDKYTDNGYKKIKVKCFKLNNFIQKLNINKIDLIKLDCEGTELDILKSFNIANNCTILNIAMETHACYSQKELCSILFNKGFIIDKIIKFTQPSNTGFLYCSYKADKNKLIKSQPIADFDFNENQKNYVFIDDTIIPNADKSFAINEINPLLKYKWTIVNTTKTIKKKGYKIKYKTNTLGLHKVKLEVNLNSKKDDIQKEIYTVKKDYFLKNIDYTLLKQNEEINAEINNTKKVFCIPAKLLPKYKRSGNIIVSTDRVNIDNNLILEFNKQKYNIKNYFEEISLKNILFDLDIIFTINPENNQSTENIKIKWWDAPLNNYENNKKSDMPIKGTDDYILPKQGEESLFLFNGKKKLIINHEMFPVTWDPNRLVIGISSLHNKNLTDKLQGQLIYSNKKYDLNDYYYEIKINDFDLENNLDFIIELTEKSFIKVNWWNE